MRLCNQQIPSKEHARELPLNFFHSTSKLSFYERVVYTKYRNKRLGNKSLNVLEPSVGKIRKVHDSFRSRSKIIFCLPLLVIIYYLLWTLLGILTILYCIRQYNWRSNKLRFHIALLLIHLHTSLKTSAVYKLDSAIAPPFDCTNQLIA